MANVRIQLEKSSKTRSMYTHFIHFIYFFVCVFVPCKCAPHFVSEHLIGLWSHTILKSFLSICVWRCLVVAQRSAQVIAMHLLTHTHVMNISEKLN